MKKLLLAATIILILITSCVPDRQEQLSRFNRDVKVGTEIIDPDSFFYVYQSTHSFLKSYWKTYENEYYYEYIAYWDVTGGYIYYVIGIDKTNNKVIHLYLLGI